MKAQKKISIFSKNFFYFIFFVVVAILFDVGTAGASDIQICAPASDNCIYYSGKSITYCESTQGCKKSLRTLLTRDGYSSNISFCSSSIDPNNCYNKKVDECVLKKDSLGNSFCKLVSFSSNSSTIGQTVINEEEKDDEKHATSKTPFPTLENPLSSSATPQKMIGKIINIIMGLVGSLALIMFIFGGISWMTAGGNEEKVKKSIGIIVWSVIGLAAIFLSYALVRLLITNVI